MVNTRQKLINYAYNILARRRYTKEELRQKLNARNLNFETPLSLSTIEGIIFDFEAAKLINDQEYAEMYIASTAQRKPQGLNLIKHKMKAKGLDINTVTKAIATSAFVELDQAHRLAQKICLTQSFQKLSNEKQRMTLLRRLASRGFCSSVSHLAAKTALHAGSSNV